LKFRDLNPVGRLAIVVIGLLTFGIAAVAFATSYDALYDWISQQNLYGDQVNKIWPLLLDAGFITAQLAAILAGIMRAVLGGDSEVHRGWPITAMLISGSLTIWFNVLHAGDSWAQRVAAALPPVLMMLAFEIDVSIVKWIMKALGKPLHQTTVLAPGMLPAGYPAPYQLPPAGPVPGAIWRPDQAPYGALPPGVAGYGPGSYAPPALYGQTPTWAPSQIPQTGQEPVGGNGDQAEATKRRQVEAHLAALGSDQLGRLNGLGPRAAARELTATLNGQGLQVSERYVQQIWDDWTAAARQHTNGRRRKH
jgi:hypothetical protein